MTVRLARVESAPKPSHDARPVRIANERAEGLGVFGARAPEDHHRGAGRYRPASDRRGVAPGVADLLS